MSRRLRAVSALVAMFAMLFAPIAMALHACPFAGDMAAMRSMAAQASDDAGTPMETAPCERHCAQAKASVDLAKPSAPVAAPFVAALRVAALAPLPLGAPALNSPFAIAAGPAPPLIGYTVLRI